MEGRTSVLTGILLVAIAALMGLALFLALSRHNLNRIVGALTVDLGDANTRIEKLESGIGERDALLDEERNERARAVARGATLEGHLAKFKEANREDVEVNDQLARERDYYQGQVDLLKKAAVHIQVHTVYLDGMPRAGKTTLIERLTNPMATPEQLDRPDSTVGARKTAPVPLCWEERDGKRILHAVVFGDIAGSAPEHIQDLLGQHTGSKAVALVLWDAAGRLEENAEHLSAVRIRATYEPQVARDVINSHVVFLNKVDLVAQQCASNGNARGVDEVVLEHKQFALNEIFRRALKSYPEPQFIAGSARSGAGLQDCLGAIIQGLNLQHVFAPSASGGAPPAEERPQTRRS